MAPLKDREPDVQVGSKRKRIPSGTENYHPPARSVRNAQTARYKRQKAVQESEESSGMDVDDTQWQQMSDSDLTSDDDDDEPELSSTDDFWINHAPVSKLSRLRRIELVRLAGLAGIDDDNNVDDLTKPQIAEAIVSVRETESVPATPGGCEPPTSPSSDDGNDGGGEETDAGHERFGLGRRATDPTLLEPASRPLKGRSFSLNLLGSTRTPAKTRARLLGRSQDGLPTRRYASQNNLGMWRSSPPAVAQSRPISPPATRMRKRDTRKTNGKHVEFKESVEAIVTTDEDEIDEEKYLADKTPMPRRQIQIRIPVPEPSPRRTRSKAKAIESSDSSRRAIPPRRAKDKIGNLAESETNDEDDDDDMEQEDDKDELDQLEPSRTPSPAPMPVAKGRQRTVRRRVLPTSNSSASYSSPQLPRRRLRPRGAQTHTPPSDGDDGGDEDEHDTEDDEAEQDDQDDQDNEAFESVDEESNGVDATDETDADEALNTKVLRNGKTVGEIPMEEDADTVESESVGSTDDTADSEEAEDVEEDAQMDDDIDLEGATAKSLTRLKRDDLVRMCETRDLYVEGTKPQLVDALLQWRDRQQSVHCPSSASTARPPSTALPRAKRAGRQNGKGTTPVLLRDKHVHIDEPRTPPVSDSERAKTAGGHKDDGELELDLESLGLEDREIPHDKLTKMEKIGSGGFKDVFVGKFRGRKVAIAEFRGQLSAMDIKELKLLSDFDHPNVVRFLGVSVPENTRETPVAIISELCANGDLFDYVRNVPSPSLIKVLGIALDIAHGLDYLHCHKPSVIHRDCKSSNILITSKGTAKIADFGLAKVKQSTRSMVVSLVGTVNWQAPELWHAHPKYNHKVDVFSCAMVYWEMLQWHLPQKKYPWEGMNEHAIYETVGAKRQRPSLSGMRKQWCPELIDLIEAMWAHDPSDRPTMSEVVRRLEAIIRQYK